MVETLTWYVREILASQEDLRSMFLANRIGKTNNMGF